MKKRFSKHLAATVVLLLIGLSGGVLLAQGSASFQLDRSVMAGGSSSASSASFAVKGTTGQAGAGPPVLSSSSYQARSGFWQPVATATPTNTPVPPSATPPPSTATPTATPTPSSASPTIYLPFITR